MSLEEGSSEDENCVEENAQGSGAEESESSSSLGSGSGDEENMFRLAQLAKRMSRKPAFATEDVSGTKKNIEMERRREARLKRKNKEQKWADEDRKIAQFKRRRWLEEQKKKEEDQLRAQGMYPVLSPLATERPPSVYKKHHLLPDHMAAISSFENQLLQKMLTLTGKIKEAESQIKISIGSAVIPPAPTDITQLAEETIVEQTANLDPSPDDSVDDSSQVPSSSSDDDVERRTYNSIQPSLINARTMEGDSHQPASSKQPTQSRRRAGALLDLEQSKYMTAAGAGQSPASMPLVTGAKIKSKSEDQVIMRLMKKRARRKRMDKWERKQARQTELKQFQREIKALDAIRKQKKAAIMDPRKPKPLAFELLGPKVKRELAKTDNQTDYRLQGDLSLYTEENLAKRAKIKQDPFLQRSIRQFWDMVPKTKGKITEREYKKAHLRLCKAIHHNFNLGYARRLGVIEWIRDRDLGGEHMSYQSWLDSIFQLVDLWTVSTDVTEYRTFIDEVFRKVTKTTSLLGKRRTVWRALQEIESPEDVYSLHKTRCAILIQRAWRNYSQKERINATVKIQRIWRAHKIRKEDLLRRQRAGIVILMWVRRNRAQLRKLAEARRKEIMRIMAASKKRRSKNYHERVVKRLNGVQMIIEWYQRWRDKRKLDKLTYTQKDEAIKNLNKMTGLRPIEQVAHLQSTNPNSATDPYGWEWDSESSEDDGAEENEASSVDRRRSQLPFAMTDHSSESTAKLKPKRRQSTMNRRQSTKGRKASQIKPSAPLPTLKETTKPPEPTVEFEIKDEVKESNEPKPIVIESNQSEKKEVIPEAVSKPRDPARLFAGLQIHSGFDLDAILDGKHENEIEKRVEEAIKKTVAKAKKMKAKEMLANIDTSYRPTHGLSLSWEEQIDRFTKLRAENAQDLINLKFNSDRLRDKDTAKLQPILDILRQEMHAVRKTRKHIVFSTMSQYIFAPILP